MQALGIDIGGSGIKGAIVDLGTGELASERLRIETPPSFHIDEVSDTIAHLVREARPLLLPFHHRGMHEVLPIGARVPRIGRRLTLRFGPHLDSNDGLADRDERAVIAWVEERLLALEAETLQAASASATAHQTSGSSPKPMWVDSTST